MKKTDPRSQEWILNAKKDRIGKPMHETLSIKKQNIVLRQNIDPNGTRWRKVSKVSETQQAKETRNKT